MKRENILTINEFAYLWHSKKGILYIVDEADYDAIDDAIQINGLTDAKEIFDNAKATVYFSIWETDAMYLPLAYLKEEWANAYVNAFIVIPSGIIVFVDEEKIRNKKD